MPAHRTLVDEYTAEHRINDPGNAGTIQVDRNQGYVPIVTTGAETRTLPRPIARGILLTICMETDGGDCVVTPTGGIQGGTTMTFDDVGDFATLVSVHNGTAFVWRTLTATATIA